MREHPGIRDAVAEAREDSPGEKRLVVYYTGELGLEAKALRAHLTETLPDYMVPATYVKLDELPLNANGKIDRKALPAPQAETFGASTYQAPLTTRERLLAEIWAEVLKIEQVGRQDNFFDLGGHSLTAVRLLSRIEQDFGRRYSLSLLFKAPTIEGFAKELGKIYRSETFSPHVVHIQPKGAKPPIFAINTPSVYYRLSRHLGDSQPFIGLQLLDIMHEKELANLNFGDIAAEYVQLMRQIQPKGPYAIMGWCVGGTLAFEAARQLSEAGDDISFVGIVNAWAPAQAKRLRLFKTKLIKVSLLWRKLVNDWHNHKSIAGFVAKKLSYAELQTEPAALTLEQRPQTLAENLSRLAGNYEFEPFCGKATMFSASLEPKDIFDPTFGWREFCREGVDVVDITGDHNSVFEEPGAGQMAAYICSLLKYPQPADLAA